MTCWGIDSQKYMGEGVAKFFLGLGNPSMSDDSVGLRLVEHFFDKAPNGFEAVDMAHDSLRILFYCEPGTEQIVVVDCVDMGLAAGEYRIFRPENVESLKEISGFSTHEGDVLKALELGRQLGYTIPPVTIFGIQPENTAFGFDLSAQVSARYDEYVRELSSLMSRL
jgi:hydrogenase maturation protease